VRGLPEEAIPPSETGDGAAPVVPAFKHRGSAISHSIEEGGISLNISAGCRGCCTGALARLAARNCSDSGCAWLPGRESQQALRIVG
jgi:hypothetical protein